MLNSCLHGKNVTVSYFCTQYWSNSTGLWSCGFQFRQFLTQFLLITDTPDKHLYVIHKCKN